MAATNVCWGIEVGAGSITALKLEASGDTLSVLDFAIIPHKKVLSTPETDPNDILRVTLGQFVGQYELGKAGIVVSVPGHSAFARFAKLPPVEPKKVPDIVKFEAVQQIPFPIDEVEWDYQTFQAPDSPDIEVGIFAITRERIMERLALYEDVGFVPDAVTLSPVAAYNALAYDLAFTEQTPGTIILDIGTTSTDLIVAEAGRVWIRTFPIGGHHFTEALVNTFKLSYSKAEKLKKEAEQSKHARHIFQAMRPVFADLAQDVNRSIGYYTSLHRDAKLTRLIGLGSTFRLPGLRKYLKQQIGLDVYRLEQFKRLSVEGPRAGEFQAATLNLATAYGLALQGLGLATLEANLMPTAVLREAMWQRKVKWFGLAAGIAVASGAAMAIRPFLDSSAVAGAPPSPTIRQTISELRSLKSEAADVTSPGTPNRAAAAALALVGSRDLYGHVVADLGALLEAAEAYAQPAEGAGAQGAGAMPAYTVRSFTTRYIPPGGAAEAARQAGRGRGRGRVDEDEAASGDQSARIRVELVVSTTQPDARRFALATLDGWLRQNAEREGVPYRLEARGPATLENEETIGAVASRPGSDRRLGAAGPDSRVDPRSAAGAQSHQPVDNVLEGGPRDFDEAPASPAVRGAEAANPEVGRLAPLGAPPALPEGTKVSTFRVEWDAVIVPADGQEREGGRS